MRRGGLNLRPIWIITVPYWLATRRGECQTPAWSITHTNWETQAHIRAHNSINAHKWKWVRNHTVTCKKEARKQKTRDLKPRGCSVAGDSFRNRMHAFCLVFFQLYFTSSGAIVLFFVVFFFLFFLVWSTGLCASPHGPSDAGKADGWVFAHPYYFTLKTECSVSQTVYTMYM